MFVVDSGASMHILSKRGSSPAEMDTSRRSRTPVTVVTANGEIQTTEEAQVYVHDLGLFVTVQILEETPAVLSLGKFWKEHGYQWISGQEPRLTRNGKIICKTDNFIPLVAPVRFRKQFVFNIENARYEAFRVTRSTQNSK